mmetsp:Transcript_50323/g.143881  ORF Transcript_50323/g.143881 Transcript_50323/m.143881 type:complete len:519 (-) Transcript_50323:2328-3884(-)
MEGGGAAPAPVAARVGPRIPPHRVAAGAECPRRGSLGCELPDFAANSLIGPILHHGLGQQSRLFQCRAVREDNRHTCQGQKCPVQTLGQLADVAERGVQEVVQLLLGALPGSAFPKLLASDAVKNPSARLARHAGEGGHDVQVPALAHALVLRRPGAAEARDADGRQRAADVEAEARNLAPDRLVIPIRDQRNLGRLVAPSKALRAGSRHRSVPRDILDVSGWRSLSWASELPLHFEDVVILAARPPDRIHRGAALRRVPVDVTRLHLLDDGSLPDPALAPGLHGLAGRRPRRVVLLLADPLLPLLRGRQPAVKANPPGLALPALHNGAPDPAARSQGYLDARPGPRHAPAEAPGADLEGRAPVERAALGGEVHGECQRILDLDLALPAVALGEVRVPRLHHLGAAGEPRLRQEPLPDHGDAPLPGGLGRHRRAAQLPPRLDHGGLALDPEDVLGYAALRTLPHRQLLREALDFLHAEPAGAQPSSEGGRVEDAPHVVRHGPAPAGRHARVDALDRAS